MDELYVTATFSVLILLISVIWFVKGKPRDHPLPPGPRGLPIVGYLPFLGNNLLHQFTELGHQYGPIYKLHLGNKLCVVISSPSIVKEVVRDQDAVFGNRDTPVAAFVASYRGNAVVWSPHNSQWRSMRKLCVQEMMSKTNLELSYNIRRDEIRKTIRNVYSMTMTGEPAAVEIGELSFRTQLNVIMNMLWGATVEGEEAERIAADFRVVFLEITDLFGKPNVSDFYPILAGLDFQGIKKQMEGCVQCVDRIFDEVIAKYKQDKLSGGRDQININHGKKDFLQILLELNEKGDSEMSISESQVKAMLMDMVLAGTDTLTTTVEWAMSELMNNPEVKTKVQKELSEVVGLNNIVEESHLPKLKYLEAVVKETLRLHPVVPLLVPRSPSQSSYLVGGKYNIPKNSRIFINVSSIHRDPSIWDNPMEFDPERFVVDDDDDDTTKKLDYSGNNFHYLPFGSGRRSCVGIPLAERMMVYLLASLVHSFEWKLPEGHETELVDMSETFGIVLRKTIPLVVLPNPRLSDTNLYM